MYMGIQESWKTRTKAYSVHLWLTHEWSGWKKLPFQNNKLKMKSDAELESEKNRSPTLSSTWRHSQQRNKWNGNKRNPAKQKKQSSSKTHHLIKAIAFVDALISLVRFFLLSFLPFFTLYYYIWVLFRYFFALTDNFNIFLQRMRFFFHFLNCFV